MSKTYQYTSSFETNTSNKINGQVPQQFESQFNKMQEEFGLSDNQKGKVEQMMKDYKNEVQLASSNSQTEHFESYSKTIKQITTTTTSQQRTSNSQQRVYQINQTNQEKGIIQEELGELQQLGQVNTINTGNQQEENFELCSGYNGDKQQQQQIKSTGQPLISQNNKKTESILGKYRFANAGLQDQDYLSSLQKVQIACDAKIIEANKYSDDYQHTKIRELEYQVKGGQIQLESMGHYSKQIGCEYQSQTIQQQIQQCDYDAKQTIRQQPISIRYQAQISSQPKICYMSERTLQTAAVSSYRVSIPQIKQEVSRIIVPQQQQQIIPIQQQQQVVTLQPIQQQQQVVTLQPIQQQQIVQIQPIQQQIIAQPIQQQIIAQPVQQQILTTTVQPTQVIVQPIQQQQIMEVVQPVEIIHQQQQVQTVVQQIPQQCQLVQPIIQQQSIIQQQHVQQIVQQESQIMRPTLMQLTTPVVPVQEQLLNRNVQVVQTTPMITSPLYQSVIHVAQQSPQIVRQRPIHVVDLDQYENQWKKRVEDLEQKLLGYLGKPKTDIIQTQNQASDSINNGNIEELEKQISQLQLELYKTKEDYEELLQQYKTSQQEFDKLKQQLACHICNDNSKKYEQIIQDNNNEIARLKQLLQEKAIPQQSNIKSDNSDYIKQLQQQIKNLQDQLKDANLNVEKYKQENSQLLTQQNYYKDLCQEKDKQIKELNQHIDELEADLDQIEGEQDEIIEQRVETIRQEIKTWKDKFLALNVQYHDQQEKLILVEAELDHIQKQQGKGIGGQKVTTTTTTTKVVK